MTSFFLLLYPAEYSVSISKVNKKMIGNCGNVINPDLFPKKSTGDLKPPAYNLYLFCSPAVHKATLPAKVLKGGIC